MRNLIGVAIKVLRNILQINKKSNNEIQRIKKECKLLYITESKRVSGLTVKRRSKSRLLILELSQKLIQLNAELKESLFKELKIFDDEDKQIEELERKPLFKNINSIERKILSYITYQEKTTVINLLTRLKKISEQNIEEEKQIQQIKKESEQLSITTNYHTNLVVEAETLEKINQSIEYSIIFCLDLSKKLQTETKIIYKDTKRIEKEFTTKDIHRVLDKLGNKFKREKNKHKLVTETLQYMRQVRHKVEVEHLIAVHMTDYFPQQGIIQPTINIASKNILGKKIMLPRGTIHFSFNGPVNSHPNEDWNGGWNNNKFAIIIPVEKIIDRIINVSPQDSFILGKLTLPDESEIIMKEKDYVNNMNSGHGKIIRISNKKNLRKEVKSIILKKGYTPMITSMWSWSGPTKEGYKIVKKYIENKLYDSWEWTARFEDFATRMDKDIGAHSEILWGQLEETLSAATFDLEEGEEQSIHKIEITERDIREIITKLEEKSKKYNLKEEQETIIKISKTCNQVLQMIINKKDKLIKEIKQMKEEENKF